MHPLTTMNAAKDLRVIPRRQSPLGRYSALELSGRAMIRRDRLTND